MTTNHHARDDWADARTDEALRRELDALAGLGAASSSLGDGLDGALGPVRSRIRRRRTAKQASLGATALSVAAALAVGGAALLPDAPRPLPGPAGTPTSTPSPSGDPTGDPTPGQSDEPATQGTAPDLIEDGYQPSWLAGTDVVCGMPADGLPATGGSHRLELLEDPVLEDETSADGTETVQYWRAATRLTVDDPADAGLRVAPPTLVWVQDGRVVDVGINTAEAGMDQAGDRPPEADAEDSSLTSCAPVHPTADGGADTYDTDLPAGTYEVRAFAQLWSPDGSDVEIVLSDPVSLTIPGPDGARATNAAATGEECSASGLDLPAPDLADLPDPVRDTATAMFDAATACDDAALVALAEEYPEATEANWGNRTAQELLELPGAEQDEDVYAILARLISGTRWCASDGGLGNVEHAPYEWPVVAGGQCPTMPQDWQAAVDAGAITADDAVSMRADDDYTGWRFAITADGRWQQLVDGSWEDLRNGG